jgi:hypothetical protein
VAVEPAQPENDLKGEEQVLQALPALGDAFSKIAEALGAAANEPGQVLEAFSDLLARASSVQGKSEQAHLCGLDDKIQVCNLCIAGLSLGTILLGLVLS